ncbi:UNVERIFIED_CONTAM: hypothetical protein FKN15_062192 [Acipenser sinensis]
MSGDWQQDDMLSIVTSEEVGKEELTFPSEDVESDSTSPAVTVELLPLINRATAVLLVPWPTAATSPAVSRSMDRVYDGEKLGLAQFPPVGASIAALVQAPNLALLSKDAIYPYSASAFAARLGNFNSILVAYQLDEQCLLNKNLLHLSRLNGLANLIKQLLEGSQGVSFSNTTCKKPIPSEDKYDQCMRCLGAEHAQQALQDHSFCALFTRRSVDAGTSGLLNLLPRPPLRGTCLPHSGTATGRSCSSQKTTAQRQKPLAVFTRPYVRSSGGRIFAELPEGAQIHQIHNARKQTLPWHPRAQQPQTQWPTVLNP